MKRFHLFLAVLAFSTLCACNTTSQNEQRKETSISDTSVSLSTSESSEVSEVKESDYDKEDSTTKAFLEYCKEPTASIDERLPNKPDREKLPEKIAAVLYDNVPFKVVIDLAGDASDERNRLYVNHEFTFDSFNYTKDQDADLYYRKYILADSDGDRTEELFFEVSSKPQVDNADSEYTLFFEEKQTGVVMHVLRDAAYWDKFSDILNKQGHFTLIKRPFKERLLVALGKEDILPEIAAVIYDNAPFTVLFEDYTDDECTKKAMFSREFTMADYDYYWPAESNLSEGLYEPAEICWRGYTIIDMDNDGKEEVVYYVSTFNGPEGNYLVFCVVNGEVCAYLVTYREMGTLKTDATMDGTSGASRGEIWKFDKFYKDGYQKTVLAKMCDDVCYIGNNEVSEEEFFKYINETISTKGTLWTAVEADDSWLNYYSRGEH